MKSLKLIFVLFAILSVSSCSDDEPIKEKIPEIVGTWELVSAELVNCGEESGPIDLTFTLEMTFDAEGGFYFFQTNSEGEEIETFEDEGIYIASGDKLILFGNETDPDLIEFEIDDDVLILYVSGDSECVQKMRFDRVIESK